MKKLLLFLCLIFAIPIATSPIIAAVAVDAYGTGQGTLTSTKVTSFNYTGITVGTGSNRALIFVVTIGDDVTAAPTGITATWDSGGSNQAMTLIISQADPSTPANGNQVFIFGLRNPTSGNKTLALSWTNNAWIGGNAVSFTGVEQSNDGAAFPHTNTASTITNTPVSIIITSATGNWTVGGYVTQNGTDSPNHHSFLQSDILGLFTNDNIFAQDNTGAALVTFTDTFGFNFQGWGAAAVDIAAGSGAPITVTRRTLTGVGN